MPTGLDALIRFAEAIGREFSVPVGGDRGILVGGYNGRGDHNVRHTDMPAVLREPLFGSDPAHVEWIRSEAGQTRPARAPVDSTRRFFQKGGRIASSVGHKCKSLVPSPRGGAGRAGGASGDAEESGREEEAGAVGAKEADKGRRLAGRRALL